MGGQCDRCLARHSGGVHERTLSGIWRTSNNAEAWHGAFGKAVDCAHPGVYKFLDELAKEKKLIATKVDHLRKNGQLAPRDKKYVRFAKRMLSIFSNWDENPNGLLDYVRRVGHHMIIRIWSSFAFSLCGCHITLPCLSFLADFYFTLEILVSCSANDYRFLTSLRPEGYMVRTEKVPWYEGFEVRLSVS